MVGPESSHGVSRVVHHKDYYLRGGDMTVLVENHLYRIHSYFFERESLFFRNKLSTSDSGSEGERGSTDNNAYTLENVKSEDFARLLWVFYNPKYSLYDAPLETWISIIKLANLWTFDSVKELCVRELEKIEIDAVEKIAIYHEEKISRLYLIPSYVNVCKRDKPLSFTEGMSLGMETVLRIAEARERLRQQTAENCMRTPTFEDFEDAQVEVLIREIFQLGSRPASPAPGAGLPNGVNGSTNGTIKLDPAPSSKPAKANGAGVPRANGGSVADTKKSSLDAMHSIDSVISPQAPPTATTTTATIPATTTTPITATAPQETQSQVPPAQTPAGPTQSTSPAQPPPVPVKSGNSQQTSSFISPLSFLGVGEPSSSVETDQRADSSDVSITVVPTSPTENCNDLTAKSKDVNVNDAEKDESGKDNDTASVVSDVEAGKNKQGTRGRGRGAKSTGNVRKSK